MKTLSITFLFLCALTAMYFPYKAVEAAFLLRPTPTSNLQAYWTFDAKHSDWSINSIFDSSGNGHTGIAANMTSGVNQGIGKIGQALFFDGALTSVALGSSPVTVGGNTDSVCAWVRTNDITVSSAGWNQTFLNLFTDTDNGLRLGNITNTGSFFASYKSAGVQHGVQTSAQVFQNNKWTHVCYIWDGADILLYVNGAVVSTTGNTDSIDATNTIGARNDQGDGVWYGSLDDMRIYSRALSAAEIRQIYASGSIIFNGVPSATVVLQATNPGRGSTLVDGLVGYWSFNNQDVNWSIGRSIDRSGQGNNGLFVGLSTSTAPQAGVMGQAFAFDGTDDSIMHTTSYDFEDTSAFSVSAWMKTSSTATETIAATWSDTIAGGWRLAANADVAGSVSLLLSDANASSYRLGYAGNALNNGKWHHVVVSYDGSQSANGMKFYIDGILTSTTVVSDNAPGSLPNSNFYIGRIGGSIPQYFAGLLDDVRVYNRAVSALEARKLYEMGR